MTKFSITQDEYDQFEATYTWTLLEVPTYRYGQAFLNYFHPQATNYLSHVNAPWLRHAGVDEVLWSTTNADLAKDIIKEFVKII